MSKGRLEAFSDGVVAILITIMILDLRMPHGADLPALRPALPHFLIYVLSFIFLGIYWSNHHHMFHAVHHVNGAILWANLHLLFWLSLVPLVTGWIGENGSAAVPTAAYGVVLLCCAIAYTLLQTLIIRHEPDAVLASAVGSDLKAKVSLALCGRDSAGVRESHDLGCDLRHRRADMAGARPPDRVAAGSP